MTDITLKIKLTNNNQTFEVKVKDDESILKLKEAAQTESGLKPEEQNMVYKGRILADDKLVKDYSVGDGHILF